MVTFVLILALMIAVAVLIGFVLGYNKLRTADVQADEALGGIDVQLTRRAALIPGLLATALYAKNLLNFITPLIDKETKGLKIDWNDEIIKGTLLTRDGQVVHPQLQG